MNYEFDSFLAEGNEKPGKNMDILHEQKWPEEMRIVRGRQWHAEEGINEC